MNTSLYRLYDIDATLLYIGIAGNPGRRFEQHAKDKPWWGHVTDVRLEHFLTREAAILAEADAIRTENPKHNIMLNRSRPAPMPAGVPMPENRLDRLSAAADQPLLPNSLVGSFFHTYLTNEENGLKEINRQGCVVAEPSPGVYLIELFSWLGGNSTEQQLVRLEEMFDWTFYDTAEWMKNTYRSRPGNRDWDD